jgi:hypothetical protein
MTHLYQCESFIHMDPISKLHFSIQSCIEITHFSRYKGLYRYFSHVPEWIKVASKFDNHHVSRRLHSPYSPEISLCDCWLFGMLNVVVKDRQFNSSDEIEKAITKVWAHFRSSAERRPQLDEPSCMGYCTVRFYVPQNSQNEVRYVPCCDAEERSGT